MTLDLESERLSLRPLVEADSDLGIALFGDPEVMRFVGPLLRFAFEETPLEEVAAVTDPDNRRSQQVLRKIGMTYEGLRPAYRTQCPGFRITRRPWLAAQP